LYLSFCLSVLSSAAEVLPLLYLCRSFRWSSSKGPPLLLLPLLLLMMMMLITADPWV
jgi:hypothetical protein